jgi:N-acetylneuraminate synthase
VEFLEKMDVPAHKIASLELVDDELLACVAQTRKPVFLATGLAAAEEIEHALEVLDKHGAGGVVLLHCVSAYPAKTGEMNLRTLPDMTARFGRLVGLSDHSTTHTSAIGAVALGACVVEKHFTLDRAAGGPDGAFSLEPPELTELVASVRAMESALGSVHYGPTPGETASMAFRRSLYAVRDIRAGETLTRDNIRAIRPGGGLAPRWLPDILGGKAAREMKRGEAVVEGAVEVSRWRLKGEGKEGKFE